MPDRDAAPAAAKGAGASRNAQEGQQAASPAAVASVPTVDAAAVLRTHKPRERTFYDNGTPYDGLECWCGPWRGDAAAGGCEAVLLAKRVIELEEALAQWGRWANPPFVPGAAWPVGEE